MVALCHFFCVFSIICYNTHNHLLITFAEALLHFFIAACRLSGRNLPGLPSRDSNSGAAPYWAALHWLLRFVTFTFFDVFVLCAIRFVTQYVLWRNTFCDAIRFVTQYVLWRCTLCNVYVLKFLRFVFLLSVQLRLVTYTYVNVYVVCIYVM